eukprot:1160178-Pelagomonas_calceolata.AAC.3
MDVLVKPIRRLISTAQGKAQEPIDTVSYRSWNWEHHHRCGSRRVESSVPLPNSLDCTWYPPWIQFSSASKEGQQLGWWWLSWHKKICAVETVVDASIPAGRKPACLCASTGRRDQEQGQDKSSQARTRATAKAFRLATLLRHFCGTSAECLSTCTCLQRLHALACPPMIWRGLTHWHWHVQSGMPF